MIYQQNTIGGNITVFDETKGYEKVGEMAFGDNLICDSIVLSADTSTLYANATNRWEFWQQPLTEQRSAFAAFDAKTFDEKWRIALPGSIEHFAASPCKRYIYNAHYDRKLVTKVDVETQDVTPIQTANMGGHKVRVSADGERCYVGSIVWGSFDEIDTQKNVWKRHYTFEDNVRPFVLTSDGKTAYIQLSRLHGFHVFDLHAWTITRTVKMPGALEGAGDPPCEDRYPFTIDHGAEITPDGHHLVMLATTGHYAAVYTLPDLELVKTIPLGKEPSYLTMAATKPLCYISCRASSALYVVDTTTWDVVHILEKVGAFPQRVCVDH
ncbi:MAG: hypothetical protein AAGA36_06400 [Pseudomonadota bacterium]